MDSLVLGKWCKRGIGCALIVIISICLGGCWDREELQERRFVLAIAIDKAEEGVRPDQEKITQVENFYQPHGNKLYRLSLQLLQLAPSQGSESGQRGKTSTSLISTTGQSMTEMLQDMLGQSDKDLWFEHVQTVVISEEAIRQGGLQPITDYLLRSQHIRWLTKVLITSGEARAILEYKPPSGEPSGMFIADSLDMYRKNPHVPGWHTDVGSIAESHDNKQRVLMARIELADDIIKLGGMAILKDGKLIGYVDEYATQGGKFLSGIEKSAIITFECPDSPGKIAAFELFSHQTSLTPKVEGDNIYYILDIKMRGNIGEMQCGIEHHVVEDHQLHKLEELVAEAVKKNILYSFHTYQNLKVDASVFGQKLQAYEPLMWEKVKDRWDDEVFPTIPLIVSVNVVIENVGAHK